MTINQASEAEWADGPHVAEDAPRSKPHNQCRAAKAAKAHVRVGEKRQRSKAQGRVSEATAAGHHVFKNGAGNGIRTRDFDLGKVALYH